MMSLLLKYAFFCVAMVMTVDAKLGPFPGKTGYFATGLYYSDSKCQTTPLLGATYQPVGVCMNQTTYTTQSYMYTTDPTNNNKMYVTQWFGSASCNSVAPFVAPNLSNVTISVTINSTCSRRNKQSIGYVATLPTVVYPQFITTFYGFSGCANGVVTSIQISTMFQNTDYDGSYYCYSDGRGFLPYYPSISGCASTQSRQMTTCPTPPGDLVTGYASATSFSGLPCTAANSVESQYIKLGVCVPPSNQDISRRDYSILTGYTTGSTTVFVRASYKTKNCGGTAYLYHYIPTGYCPATSRYMQGFFNQYSLVSAPPTIPSTGTSTIDYATPAACAVTDPTQIVSATYSPVSNYTQTTQCYGDGRWPPRTRTLCGPQSFTSTTGGFVVIKNYADFACATTPTGLTFVQVNICTANNSTTSSQYTVTSSTNGVTVLSASIYRNTACSGTPLSILSNLANTTQICQRRNSASQWSTTTFSSVLGINSGYIQAQYTTPSACAAKTQASLFFGQGSSNTCGLNTVGNSSRVVLNACGVPTAAAVLQVLYFTQTISSASLTLATAQSSAFQTTFQQAVSSIASVALSAVQVHH